MVTSRSARENLPYGTRQTSLSLHSASSGLSHGNHTGMGFRERQGAGNSMDLQVPGDAHGGLTQTYPGKYMKFGFDYCGPYRDVERNRNRSHTLGWNRSVRHTGAIAGLTGGTGQSHPHCKNDRDEKDSNPDSFHSYTPIQCAHH